MLSFVKSPFSNPFFSTIVFGIYAGIFGQGINFLNNIVLSRILDTKSYGNLTVVLSNIAFLQNFILPGFIAVLPITISTFDISKSKYQRNNFIINLGFFVIISSILISLLSFCINFFFDFWHIDSLDLYFLLFFWIIFGSFDLLALALFNGLKEYKKMAIYSTIKGILTISVSFFFVRLYSFEGIFYAYMIVFFASFIVFLWLIKDIFDSIKIHLEFKISLEYVIKCFPIFVAGFAMTPVQWGINQYLIHQKEYYILAVFGILNPWLILVQFVPHQLLKVLVPFMTDKNKDVSKISRITNFLTIGLTAILVLILFLVSSIVLKMYNYDIEQIRPLFYIVLGTSFFSVINIVFGQKILIGNKFWQRAFFDFVLSFIILVSFFVLYCYSDYKIEAIFVAYFFGFLSNFVIMYFFVRERSNQNAI